MFEHLTGNQALRALEHFELNLQASPRQNDSLTTTNYPSKIGSKESVLLQTIIVVLFAIFTLARHRRKQITGIHSSVNTIGRIFIQCILATTLAGYMTITVLDERRFSWTAAKACPGLAFSLLNLTTFLSGYPTTCGVFFQPVLSATMSTANDELSEFRRLAYVTAQALLLFGGLMDLTAPFVWEPQFFATPMRQATIFQKLLFEWLQPLLDISKRQPIVEADLYDLETSMLSQSFAQRYSTVIYSKPKYSLLYILMRMFPTNLSAVFAFSMIGLTAKLTIPWMFQEFLRTASLPYLAGIAAVKLIGAICERQAFYQLSIMSTGIKAALSAVIFETAMSKSKKDRDAAVAPVNLLAVDLQKVVDFVNIFPDLWCAPISTFLSFGSIVALMGLRAAAASTACTLIIFPLVQLFSRIMKTRMGQVLAFKDARTLEVTQILRGIASIKAFGWQNSFIKRLNDRREAELQCLGRLAFLNAAITGLVMALPQLMASSAFLATAYFGGCLSTSYVFSAISLFQILNQSLTTVPGTFIIFLAAKVSFDRVKAFVGSPPQLAQEYIAPTASNKPSLTYSDASFGYKVGDAEMIVLTGTQLVIDSPGLYVITGQTSSGKSTLLEATMGYVEPIDGRVSAIGRLAFMSQQPFLIGGTIKENIIFGEEFIPEWYDTVVSACGVDFDLRNLALGDETAVGSTNAALSGGQKTRIALARAVYSRPQIIILDDPFAAIDGKVARDITQKLLGSTGILRDCIRLVSTNDSQLISHANMKFAIRDGKLAGELQSNLNQPQRFANKAQPAGDQAQVDLPTKALDSNTLVEEAAAQTELPSTLAMGAKRVLQGSVHSGLVPFSVYWNWLTLANPLAWFAVAANIILARAVQTAAMYSLKRYTEGGSREMVYLYGFATLNLVQVLVVALFILAAFFWCLLPAARRIHRDLVEGVIRSPMHFYTATSTGEILNRFTADIMKIDGPLAGGVMSMIIITSVATMTLTILATASPMTLAFIIPAAVAFHHIQRRYLQCAIEMRRIELYTRSGQMTSAQEAWSAGAVICSHDQRPFFRERNFRRLNRHTRAFFLGLCLEAWVVVRLEALAAVFTFLVGWTMVHTNCSADTLGFVMTYILAFNTILVSFVRLRATVELDMVSVQRILEYTTLKAEGADVALSNPLKQPPTSWPTNGRVVFYNVDAHYSPELPNCLKRINLVIEPGQKTAVVGRTGAGKSSLALVLARFLETCGGAINIDGINIQDVSIEALRSKITSIPQEPHIFSGSLRDNIDPQRAFDDDSILQVLSECRCVDAFPGGLQFKIQNDGSNVSRGHAQIIALARAMLRKTKVLIMDEATASVDADMDALVQSLIRKRFKEQTVITIAHRLASILDYDMVVVMDAGAVVEYDSPGLLFRTQDSLFSKMITEAGLTQLANNTFGLD